MSFMSFDMGVGIQKKISSRRSDEGADDISFPCLCKKPFRQLVKGQSLKFNVSR